MKFMRLPKQGGVLIDSYRVSMQTGNLFIAEIRAMCDTMEIGRNWVNYCSAFDWNTPPVDEEIIRMIQMNTDPKGTSTTK